MKFFSINNIKGGLAILSSIVLWSLYSWVFEKILVPPFFVNLVFIIFLMILFIYGVVIFFSRDSTEISPENTQVQQGAGGTVFIIIGGVIFILAIFLYFLNYQASGGVTSLANTALALFVLCPLGILFLIIGIVKKLRN